MTDRPPLLSRALGDLSARQKHTYAAVALAPIAPIAASATAA